MLVVEALELKMEPGDYSDENKLNLTWEMINFTEENIYIQLYFEYPQRVSEYIEYDTLEVFFWGVDWFRSSKGEPVRYGTRLARPILRQIDPEYARTLGTIGHLLSTLAALFMLIACIVTGRLLPTWMFFNTLQIISHFPLFKTEVPAPAAYFLSHFLDLTRFNMMPPLFNDFASARSRILEGPLNMTFDAYGYSSMYLSGNMPVILLALILTLILTLLSALKAACVYAMNKGSPGKGCIRDIFWLNSHT